MVERRGRSQHLRADNSGRQIPLHLRPVFVNEHAMQPVVSEERFDDAVLLGEAELFLCRLPTGFHICHWNYNLNV